MDWLDQLHEGVLLIDGDRVRYANRAAARFLQVDPLRIDDRPLIAVVRDHRIERAWLDRKPVELEARGRRLLVRPIDGGLALHDVTELRGREDEARDLLAVLSHELRTPVTTIRSTLEALDADLPHDQRERFLARALLEADRLVRLLEDLTVDVAPPHARTVRLVDAFDRAEALLAPLLATRRIEVVRVGPDVTAWIDPDKLLQIVLNLLENAALHGPTDSVVVLEVRPADPAAQVEVAVRDEGTPLDPHAFEGLFAPHRRGRGVDARGSGLGLYIVRSIAERAGGRAWGRPHAGGNEFGVSLPRSAGHQEMAGPSSRSA